MDDLRVGARVEAERRRRGWSRQRLADEIGCSLGTVKNFEGYEVIPPGTQYVKAFEAVLGIDLTGSQIDSTDPRLSQASDWALTLEIGKRLERARSVIDSPQLPNIQISGVPLESSEAQRADGP